MRVRVLPYKIGSQSAKLIAQGLGVLRCNPLNTRFRPRREDIVINWGCSYFAIYNNRLDRPYDCIYINDPMTVGLAKDKRRALGAMEQLGVSVIPFTQDKEQAIQWIEEGSYVYERHTLYGHGGSGIRVVHSVGDLTAGTSVQLYTKGIPIRREYRVHVFDGKVIEHVQKRKRLDTDPNLVSDYIRNHTQGWVFVKNGFDYLSEVEEQAIKAVQALGLDFGAVDVITEKHTGDVYVLEVNTACGFDPNGSTLRKYITAFKEKIGV